MIASLSKAERTRQFIIEKTAPVFNAKGYAGTSMNDLTAATGLTKGSIYGNFEDKDEVALAAFDYNFQKVTAFLREKILATDDAIQRLMVYPQVYRNFLKLPIMKMGCPILNTATESDDTHPELRKKVMEALAFWKRSVENQIKRGIERREIKPGTDPSRIAVIIISMIEGSIMQAKATGRSKELAIAMDFLEEMILSLRN